MNPWMFWWELWRRSAMVPFEAMAAASEAVPTVPPAERERRKEEYLVAELHEDLERQGVQGILDEGGRS